MCTGYIEAKYESTPGNETNTPTLSTKQIFIPAREVAVKLNAKHLERDDELRNACEPISLLPEAYDPDWELDSRAYPDTVGFELKQLLGAPTSTAGNGVITDPDAATIPTGATRHVWTAPYGPSGAFPQTTQRNFAYKDEAFFLKGKGCAASSLELESPESGGVGLKVAGPLLYLTRISDPALTPSYEALTVPPFERSHLTLQTWLSGSATFEDFTVAVANPVETVRSLGIASKYPDVMEKAEGPVVITGTANKRHIDPDDWDALVAATGFTIKARWQSTVVIGATSYVSTLWFQATNGQYVDGGPEPLTAKRRLGGEFNWKATYTGTAGSTTWTLVNGTASYA